jgi:O-antigen/teichoic acid export membrane protein
MSYNIIKYLPWVRNFSSTVLNRVISTLSQIILIPIFVNLWGKEFYGEWLLLCTLPNYLYASDFGINATVTNEVCSLVAKKKHNEALDLFRSTNMASLLLTFISSLLFIISSYVFDWKEIMNIKLFSEQTVETTLFFLIISVFSYFFFGAALGIYRSEGRYDKFMNFVTILQVADLISLLINLYLKANILSISISSFVIRLLLCSFIIVDLQNKYLWFRFGFSFNMRVVLPLLPTSIYYMIITMGQGLVIQGTTFLIGTHLGASTLVTFSTIRTLINSIKAFVGAFYSSFLPEFTVTIAQNQYKRAQRLYKVMLSYTFLFTIAFTIFYYLLGDYIIFYWTKGKINLEQPFFNYMLVLALVNTLGSCAYTVLNATNENKVVGIFYAILSFFTIIGVFFTVNGGLPNVVTILLIADSILLVISFLTALQVVKGGNNFKIT